MSDIKVINIKDSSFKMWESDASGSDASGSYASGSDASGSDASGSDAGGSDAGEASGSVAGGAAIDRGESDHDDQDLDQDLDQDFDEKSQNLFESSTMSGGSEDGFQADDSNKLDLFEDNASSFSDQSGGSKKNKSVSESELEDDESLLEELSRDPLMIVLGNFLISRKGNNIADILEDIRDHLGYIRHYLSEAKGSEVIPSP